MAIPLLSAQTTNGKPQSAAANGYGLLLGNAVIDSSQSPARGATVSIRSLASSGKISQTLVDPSRSFSSPRLEAGTYSLSVSLSGYLLEVDSHEDTTGSVSGERSTRVVGVTIEGGGSQTINLRLVHAASIGGTALWEDGAPVVGANVEVETFGSTPDKLNFPRLGRTDDLGRFRVPGLEPGRYRVAVLPRLSTPSDQSDFVSRPDYDQAPAKLRIYAKAAFDAKSAEVFTLDRGADLSNVEVTVPLSCLHSVRGRIEFVNKAQGALFVGLSRTPDAKIGSFAPVRADGVFDLELVPSGTYRMKIYGPNKAATSQEAHPEHANEEEDLALVYEQVLQVTGDIVDLPVRLP